MPRELLDVFCPCCQGHGCMHCADGRTFADYERVQVAQRDEIACEDDIALAWLLIAVLTQDPTPRSEEEQAQRLQRACRIAKAELRDS